MLAFQSVSSPHRPTLKHPFPCVLQGIVSWLDGWRQDIFPPHCSLSILPFQMGIIVITEGPDIRAPGVIIRP